MKPPTRILTKLLTLCVFGLALISVVPGNAQERVFTIRTGGIKGVPTDQAFHITYGPRIYPSHVSGQSPVPNAGTFLMEAGGRFGDGFYENRVFAHGRVEKQWFDESTFLVYTTSQIDDLVKRKSDAVIAELRQEFRQELNIKISETAAEFERLKKEMEELRSANERLKAEISATKLESSPPSDEAAEIKN